MKSFGVTIQMKSLQQFFHMLILILSFGNLKMEFGIFAIFFLFYFGHHWEWKEEVRKGGKRFVWRLKSAWLVQR